MQANATAPASPRSADCREGDGLHSRAADLPPRAVAYRTNSGFMLQGMAEDVLASKRAQRYQGRVQLIFTSPPFPLNRKKKYGNREGQDYVDWLAAFAPIFKSFLTPNGSIVIEMGNAWEKGHPVMSVLSLEALLAFLKKGSLKLCQQFVCDNPARLPGPIQWVNVERARVKDSFTHVWWMAADARPLADNRRVLKEYSKSMKSLLARQKYNGGKRPSDHLIGKTSFLTEHKGAIPSNVLSFANTANRDLYRTYCLANGIKRHPARMPVGLVDFFVRFLTNKNDLVLDPFAGSNTTGSVAESLGRRWISIEPRPEYIEGSKGRFPSLTALPSDESDRTLPRSV